MRVRKSICGLCKPSKKWKSNNTRLKSKLNQALLEGELTANLIKSYTKISQL